MEETIEDVLRFKYSVVHQSQFSPQREVENFAVAKTLEEPIVKWYYFILFTDKYCEGFVELPSEFNKIGKTPAEKFVI